MASLRFGRRNMSFFYDLLLCDLDMNFKSFLLFTVISFVSYAGLTQEKPYVALGNAILKSVETNDATLFKSLIIPEDAVWLNLKKMYASEWTKEEEKQVYLELPENYKSTVENDFMTKFSLMVTKTQTFKLNFDTVEYELLDDYNRFDKELGVVRVFGTVNHSKFKYFSFGMIGYKNKYYIVDPRVDITEVNKYSERDFLNNVTLSADVNGNLESMGSMSIQSSKNDAEVFQCLIDDLMLYGIEETKLVSDYSSASYIKGQWQFPYRINDSNDYIGMISYNFEYKLYKGVLYYKYSNYFHDQEESNYKSIGLLPLHYTEAISKVFTKNAYYEMLYDTEINLKHAIKKLKQSVDKCD
ncbi:hypothetical protein [Psychroserpens sp. MEBiC05023]